MGSTPPLDLKILKSIILVRSSPQHIGGKFQSQTLDLHIYMENFLFFCKNAAAQMCLNVMKLPGRKRKKILAVTLSS